MCQIEVPLDAVEPILDAAHALIYTIEPAALNCDLRLHMPHLGHDVTKRGFKPSDSSLEVRDVGAHLVLPALEGFHSASQERELLHHEVGGFVGHKLNLVQV